MITVSSAVLNNENVKVTSDTPEVSLKKFLKTQAVGLEEMEQIQESQSITTLTVSNTTQSITDGGPIDTIFGSTDQDADFYLDGGDANGLVLTKLTNRSFQITGTPASATAIVLIAIGKKGGVKAQEIVISVPISLPANSWTPDAIASQLVGWYDFTDTGIISTSVREGANVISQVNDRGPNGLHATQPGDFSRPGVGLLNGRRAAIFTGGKTLNFTLPAEIPQPFSIYLAGFLHASSQNYIIGCVPDFLNRRIIFQANLERFEIRFGINALINITANQNFLLLNNEPDGNLLEFLINGLDSSMLIDDVAMAEGLNCGSNSLSGECRIMGYGGAQLGGYGAVSEYIVVEGILNAGDQDKIQGYLAHKHGLADRLPIGHPYKENIPTI